jgi:hypothetical protein
MKPQVHTPTPPKKTKTKQEKAGWYKSVTFLKLDLKPVSGTCYPPYPEHKAGSRREYLT